MRLIFIALLLFIGHSQKNSIKDFKVTYVSLFSTKTYRISCNDFPRAFLKEDYTSWEPTKKSTVDSFDKLTKEFSAINLMEIDVRKIIEWKSDNHNHKYCFDIHGRFTDGYDMYQNKRLLFFFEKYLI